MNHNQRMTPGSLVKIYFLLGIDSYKPMMYESPYDCTPIHHFKSGSANATLGTIITSTLIRSKYWAYVLLEGNVKIGWMPCGWVVPVKSR